MAHVLELVWWLRDNYVPMLKVLGLLWLFVEGFVCLFIPSWVGSVTMIGLKIDAIMDFFKLPHRKPSAEALDMSGLKK